MAYLGLEWRKQCLYSVAVCSKTACQPEPENVFGGIWKRRNPAVGVKIEKIRYLNR